MSEYNGTSQAREPIAIVGMACRFPGADNLQAFWRLLCEGGNGITKVPVSRWNVETYYAEDPAAPGKTISQRGGFVSDVEGFDWRAFRISPREAKYMDPQHRLALEVAWEALEDAGIPIEAIAGTNIAIVSIVLDREYDEDVTVVYQPYTDTGDTAIAGTDYDGSQGMVTIKAGERVALITIPVFQDGATEPLETFSVEIVDADVELVERLERVAKVDDGAAVGVDLRERESARRRGAGAGARARARAPLPLARPPGGRQSCGRA